MINDILNTMENSLDKKCDEYEIYISQNKHFVIESELSEINTAKEELNLNLGVRVLKDNRMGLAFTSDLNKTEDIINQAIANTKLSVEDKNFAFSHKTKINDVKGLFDNDFDNLAIEEFVSYIKDINDKTNDISNVVAVDFSNSKYKLKILNSNGVDIDKKGTFYSIALEVKEEETNSYWDSLSSRYFDFDIDKLIENTCEVAKKSLNGESIVTGDYNAVFDYKAFANMVPILFQSLSGENVLRNRSFFTDKLNQKVSNSHLSIYDDSTIPYGLCSCKCDDEGTPSQKTTLVEKGTLKSFIYDIYNANKIDGNSTANGFRSSVASVPSISPSNVVFDFDDEIVIDDINEGIFVGNILGAHTINPFSGDFSLEATHSFKIENGEITKSIKKGMIAGNLFNLLNQCNQVKSEIKQRGNVIIPQIFMNNLRVIG